MRQNVVMIPGALATNEFWQYQEPVLSQHAHIHHTEVITQCDSIEAMANRLIDVAPQQFAIIGFSMGGYVALELYRLIPERINGLAFINSAAIPVSNKGAKERERSIDLIRKGKFDWLVELVFNKSVYDEKASENIIKTLQRMARSIGPDIYINQLIAMMDKADHESVLSTISCPTLILASANDNVMPTDRSVHLRKYIPKAELIYIERCGHVAPLEKPNVDLLRFGRQYPLRRTAN